MPKGLNIPNAIARFDEAIRTHCFMGAQPPEDHAKIQNQYDVARDNLKKAIAQECERKYDLGVSYGMSRSRSSPGNGDMGG